MENAVKFPENSLRKRMKSMIKNDFKRMFKSKLFYILIATALIIPILMTVMMTMMDGSVSVDPQTGVETVIEGPENAWQSIGTLPTADGSVMGGMDVMSMCNINMMFMVVSVFVCLFISEDFRSGYAKNLFTVRSKKSEYIVSKTLAGFLCGSFMLIFYFFGAMLGGAVSGLSFGLGTITNMNIVMCVVSKIFLMLVFVPIFVIISISVKQKVWLSICGSLGGGMLLFMTVPIISPLTSTFINVILCFVGGIIFSLGLGVASNKILSKSSLV